jgi:Nif-specific regulatory protein
VRELRNLMERLAYLHSGDTVDAADLEFILLPGRGNSPANLSLDMTLADATRQFQTDFIRKHIESSGGNMSDAARQLGLHRSNLYRKMRQLQMPLAEGIDDEESSDDDR